MSCHKEKLSKQYTISEITANIYITNILLLNSFNVSFSFVKNKKKLMTIKIIIDKLEYSK